MSKCRSCGAAIEWAITEAGKRTPVDAEPTTNGTILLVHVRPGEPPVARVQNIGQKEQLAKQAEYRGEELKLFVSHFATCPNANEHRKQQKP